MTMWWERIAQTYGLKMPTVSAPGAPSPAVRAMADRALAPRTLDSYARHLDDFAGWCVQQGMPLQPLEPPKVAEYLLSLGQDGSFSVVEQARAAISRFYRGAGLPDTTRDLLVRDTVSGLKKADTHEVQRSRAALAAEIHLMVKACSSDPAGLRDAALILVGYGAALRRSELSALTVEDVEPGPPAMLTIRRSKTDQAGKGERVPLPLVTLDAITTWCRSAGIESGRIFRPVDRWGNVRQGGLTDQVVNTVVRRRAAEAGLGGDGWTAHSLRRGAATQAHANGADPLRLRALGRWKTMECMAGYVDPASWQDPGPDALLGLSG